MGPGATDVVGLAARIADQHLFPAAGAVDAGDVVPVEHLDRLAEAGLYGVAGPRAAGGLELALPDLCAVVEALAGGDLTTTFVWLQHHGAVRALAGEGAPAALREAELPALCRGRRRAGLALQGLHPGPAALTASPAADGWLLDGTAPWVTGWGRIDAVLVAARGPDDTVVWLMVDAEEGPGLSVARVPMAAVDASATVEARFSHLPVASGRVVMVTPYDPTGWTSGGDLRLNGSLSLGLAGRCCRLLGPGPLDEELAACRSALDDSPPAAMADARAAASVLAVKAATTLVVSTGSRSMIRGSVPERLAREAQFLLVFGSRPAIRSSLLERLA